MVYAPSRTCVIGHTIIIGGVMKNENVIAELLAIRETMKNDLERVDKIIAYLRESLNVPEDGSTKLRSELFQKMYELCFETDPEAYLTQPEMYGFLKTRMAISKELVAVCERFGWSQKTANNPFWRAFVDWLLDHGHTRYDHPVTHTRCISGVKKVFWEDYGVSKIKDILDNFSEK